jgi:hypothetical protein
LTHSFLVWVDLREELETWQEDQRKPVKPHLSAGIRGERR